MNCSSTFTGVVANVLLVVAAASAQKAAPKSTFSPEQSCKAYVQKFYDWYMKAAFEEKADPAFNRALNRKAFAFSPGLAKLLKDDLAASAASPNEIVGLDWDPFVGGQDLPHHYTIKKISFVKPNCQATVEAKDPDSQAITVIPVLRQDKAGWQFVNFLYPEEKRDLVRSLKLLADDRRRNP
jgi:hypothetical protein